MRLYIKILKGNECEITVSPSHKVSEVKEILSLQVSVPVEEQKLIYKGKTLADEKRLCEYRIEDGAKLFLVQQKGSTANTPSTPIKSITDQFSAGTSTTLLWDKLQHFLHRHFTPHDAEKVLNEFRKDFNRNMASLSLDDIERLAMSKLTKDYNVNSYHPVK